MSDRDAEVRSQALREAVAWLRARADALYAAAGGAVVQLRAASETLDAAGAPAGPLVERVRACTRDGGWRDQWETLRRAKDADDIARARATRDVDILRRAARAAAVSLGEVLPDDAGPEAIAAALRRATQARVRPTMLTVAIPDLGIVAAHGDTAQALADDVASQVLHAVRDHALAAPETLAPDALVLRAKVRARLGLDGDPVMHESGAAFFERAFGAAAEAFASPEGQRFLRTMRGGLDDCGVPPEPGTLDAFIARGDLEVMETLTRRELDGEALTAAERSKLDELRATLRRLQPQPAGLSPEVRGAIEEVERLAPPPEPDIEPAVGDGPGT